MFTRGRPLRLCSAILLAFVWLSAAHAADVTGTWILDVTTPAGGGSPTFTLQQDGETVTGTYKGQLGESPVNGTLKDSVLDLAFTVNGMMGALDVRYTGTVEGDTMTGNVALGALGNGTFSGKRQ